MRKDPFINLITLGLYGFLKFIDTPPSTTTYITYNISSKKRRRVQVQVQAQAQVHVLYYKKLLTAVGTIPCTTTTKDVTGLFHDCIHGVIV